MNLASLSPQALAFREGVHRDTRARLVKFGLNALQAEALADQILGDILSRMVAVETGRPISRRPKLTEPVR